MRDVNSSIVMSLSTASCSISTITWMVVSFTFVPDLKIMSLMISSCCFRKSNLPAASLNSASSNNSPFDTLIPAFPARIKASTYQGLNALTYRLASTFISSRSSAVSDCTDPATATLRLISVACSARYFLAISSNDRSLALILVSNERQYCSLRSGSAQYDFVDCGPVEALSLSSTGVSSSSLPSSPCGPSWGVWKASGTGSRSSTAWVSGP